MSDRSSTTGNGPRLPDRDDASGAYVLNALNDRERHEFETRMSESAEIRQEVAELNETALLLGHAVQPVTPSASLRASIMDLIESTPQLPKLETTAGDENAGAETSAATKPTAASSDGGILQPTPLARQRWFMRPAVLLVGAAAAIALIFGSVEVGNNLTHTSNPGTNISAEGLPQILSASDVQHKASTVSTGGTATAYWSSSLRRSAVVLDGVPALPSSKTYQLWYINGSKVSSAGFVSATTNNVSQVLQGDMAPGDTIGITVEPSGGSKQPTSKPIVTIDS